MPVGLPRRAGIAADAGRLDLRVAATYPLDDIAAAFRRFGEGGLRGRLVLEP